MKTTIEERIDAKSWIKENPSNYIHFGDIWEGEEALDWIQTFYNAGALKVEVLKEEGYGDQENEREELFITSSTDFEKFKSLMKRIHKCCSDELEEIEDNVWRLWCDNH